MKVTRQTQSPSKLANRLVRRGPMPMALEQRFMFDGAAVAEVTHDISAESTATKDTSSIELTAVATAKDVGSAVTPAADTDSVQGAVPGLNTPYQSQELSPVPAHMSLLSTDKSNEVSAILQSGFDKTQQVVLDFVARSNTNTLFSLFNGGRAQADSAWLNTASTLQQDILNGNYQVRVELVSNTDMGGAFGVFAAKGTDGKPTIFINREWASAQTDTGSLTRVLVEEVGHSIDAALNPDRDTAGDEGEAFAAQAMNVTLNAADTLRIANENDHSTIRINAVTYEVEQASVTFTNVYSGTPSAWSEEAQQIANIQALAGTNFHFVSSNPGDVYFSGNNVTGYLVYNDVGGAEQSIYGVLSRQFKTNGVTEGFYFYAPGADGVIGNHDAGETAYVLVVDATKFAAGNSYGTSSDPVDTALNDYLNHYTRPSAVADTNDVTEKGGVNNATPGSAASGNLLSNDAGSASPKITYAGTTSATTTVAASGTTQITGTYGALIIAADGTYSYALSAAAEASAAVQALRTTTDTLTESFTYKITDSQGNTSTTTLKITIHGADDAPVAANDYGTAKISLLTDGTAYTGLSTDVGSKAVGNVLTNDTDVDRGEVPTIAGIMASGAYSSWTSGGQTTSLSFSTGNGSFYNGVVVGDYAYTDKSQTGNKYYLLKDASGNNITVTSKSINADGTYAIGLSSTPHHYSTSTTFTITGGTTQIDFAASNTSDGSSSLASAKSATIQTSTAVSYSTVTVSLTSGDAVFVGMTASGTNIPAGAKVTAISTSGGLTTVTLDKTLATAPSGTISFLAAGGTTINGSKGVLKLNADGSYEYTATPDSTGGTAGTETFKYTMQDSAGVTSTATLTINVLASTTSDPNAINDANTGTETGISAGVNPSGNVITGAITTGSGSASTADIAGSGASFGTSPVTAGRAASSASFTSITAGSFTDLTGVYGTLRLNASGSYSYTINNANPIVDGLNATQSVSEVFYYSIVNSKGGTDTATLTITINGANDAPVAVADALSATEDTPVIFLASDLLGNDTDVDNTGLTIKSVTSGTGCTVIKNADGTVTFTPNANFNGNATFTYIVQDANGGESTATVTVAVAAVNDYPVSALNTYTATEDTLLTGKNVIRDTDATGGTDSDVETATSALVIARVNGVAFSSLTDGTGSYAGWKEVSLTHGTVWLKSDGSMQYLGASNDTAGDSFNYTVTDGSAESDIAKVTLNVTPVNDPPVANAVSASGAEDAANIAITLSGSDIDGTIASYTITTLPTHGRLYSDAAHTTEITSVNTIVGGATLYFVPATNWNGATTFDYKVTDNSGAVSVASATASITVTPVNDAPVSRGNNYVAIEDTLLTGKNLITDNDASLGLDSDVEGSSLTIATINGNAFTANGTDSSHLAISGWMQVALAHGTLFIKSDGTCEYKPAANSTTGDSFTYAVSDGSATSSSATVQISVTPVADLSAGDDSASTYVDTPVTASVAGNDSTTSGGSLTFAKTSNPANGTVTVATNGSYTYTPDAGFLGSDSFTYTVTDPTSGESLVRTATITVNLPTFNLSATNDTATTNEDTSVSGSVATNDSTTSGGGLLFRIDSEATHGHATVDLNGTFSYTPDANFHGTDTFTYEVDDLGSGESLIRSVTITVNSVNDLPVAANTSFSTNEDTAHNATLPAATDADGDTITYTKASDPSHGSVVINANGSYTYSPAANYNGPDSFTYTVSDGHGGSNTYTVSITVNPVSDPAAIDAGASDIDAKGDVTEDINIQTGNKLQSTGTLSVADPDTGEAKFSTTVTDTTSGGAWGTLTITDAGVWTYSVDNAKTALQSMKAGDSRTETFNVTSADGSAEQTITVVIHGANDVPVVSNDSKSTNENTVLNNRVPFAVDADTPPEIQETYAISLSDTINRTFSFYSPTNGSCEFGVAIGNVHGYASLQDMAQAFQNHPNYALLPYTVGVNSTGTALQLTFKSTGDYETRSFEKWGDYGVPLTTVRAGVNLIYSLVSGVPSGSGALTFNADGTYSFDPGSDYNDLAAGQSRSTSFTYTATDTEGLSATTKTITITVNGVNDAPVAGDTSLTINEDTSHSATLPGATDADGDTVSYAKASDPAHGTVTVNADGSYSYTPAANYHGSDSFTYTVSDGNGGSNTYTVSITVDPVNDQPVAANTSFSINEDTSHSATLPGATDADGDTVSYAKASDPAHGTVTVNTDGSYSYTPAANYHGSDSFTYTVSDGNGGSNTYTVSITVDPVNDVASITGSAAGAVTEDTSVQAGNTLKSTGTLTVSDADTGEAKFSATVVDTTTGGAWGTLSITEAGVWSYSVDNGKPELQALKAGDSRAETFRVRSADGSAEQTITVTIHGKDDLLTIDNVTVNEASPYAVFRVSGSEGQQLLLTLEPTGSGTGYATLGVDTSTQLQYFDGKGWVGYNAASPVTYPAGSTTLLVRVAINNDGIYEGPESFTLKAQTGGITAYGIGTIGDDGRGAIYNDSGAENFDKSLIKDDDRSLKVGSFNVNEGSDYAVFTVTGVSGNHVQLALTATTASAGNATLGTDTGTQLQYFDGDWKNYTTGDSVQLPADGKLLVRVAIFNDTHKEGEETFRLTVTDTDASLTSFGTATIHDDGTGLFWIGDNKTAATDAQLAGAGKTLDDDFDLDGIAPNVEEILATMSASTGNGGSNGDLNNDGIQDADQNAVTTIAWTTVDKFNAAVTGTLTEVKPIIAVEVVSNSNVADDANYQLQDIKVLPTSGDIPDGNITGGRPVGSNGETITTPWDPIQFTVTSTTPSISLTDVDASRAGTQIRVVIDISRSGMTSSDFNAYMKYVTTDTITAAAGAGIALTDLDGKTITQAGWYDFTQRKDSAGNYVGDGARFVLGADGKTIASIVITITDNAFGDNNMTPDRILDPGVPVFKVAAAEPAPAPAPTPAPVAEIPPRQARPEAPRAQDAPHELAMPTEGPHFEHPPFDSTLFALESQAAPGHGRLIEPFGWHWMQADVSNKSANDARLERAVLADLYTDGSDWHALVVSSEEATLQVFRGMGDQYADGGTQGNFLVPTDAFVHTRTAAWIMLTAKQADGSALPDWVEFDGKTGVFKYTAPENVRGELKIKLVARDTEGREASTLFRFQIGSRKADVAGRNGLSEQLRNAAQQKVGHRAEIQRTALLRKSA